MYVHIKYYYYHHYYYLLLLINSYVIAHLCPYELYNSDKGTNWSADAQIISIPPISIHISQRTAQFAEGRDSKC
jgi:hypothetical protein